MKLLSRLIPPLAIAVLIVGMLSSCQTSSRRTAEDPIFARFVLEDRASADFAAIAQLPISGARIGVRLGLGISPGLERERLRLRVPLTQCYHSRTTVVPAGSTPSP